MINPLHNLRLWFVVITTFFITTHTYALPADKDLPMNLTSDQVTFNNKTGVTIFTGNVNMDQGTTHLKADKVTVYKSNGDIKKIVAIGNLAHYSTLPKQGEAVMNALGKTIEYYPEEKRAVIIGDGLIKQGSNAFNAEHIVYDAANETLTSIPTANAKKTTIVLEPQQMPGTKKNS